MCAVEPKVESSLCLETQSEEGLSYPFKRVKDGEVPVEHVDVEIAPPFQKGAEEVSELIWKTGTVHITCEQNAAINIPTDNKDGSSSLQRSFLESFKIGFAVNQESYSIGTSSPPAISPLNKNRPLIHFHSFILIVELFRSNLSARVFLKVPKGIPSFLLRWKIKNLPTG